MTDTRRSTQRLDTLLRLAGWGGAAGTVAFVNYKAGLRANLMTQYMPSEAYPIHEGFPKAVAADLAAMQGAGA